MSRLAPAALALLALACEGDVTNPGPLPPLGGPGIVIRGETLWGGEPATPRKVSVREAGVWTERWPECVEVWRTREPVLPCYAYEVSLLDAGYSTRMDSLYHFGFDSLAVGSYRIAVTSQLFRVFPGVWSFPVRDAPRIQFDTVDVVLDGTADTVHVTLAMSAYLGAVLMFGHMDTIPDPHVYTPVPGVRVELARGFDKVLAMNLDSTVAPDLTVYSDEYGEAYLPFGCDNEGDYYSLPEHGCLPKPYWRFSVPDSAAFNCGGGKNDWRTWARGDSELTPNTRIKCERRR